MALLRGMVVRLGLASLPLIAVLLLCGLMFSGLTKQDSKAETHLGFIPTAEAASVPSKQAPLAKFEQLHITRASIHVPD